MSFSLIITVQLAASGCAGGGRRHLGGDAGRWPDELVLTSERSGFRATETHAEVLAVLDELAARSPLARRATLGVTNEGREIPLLIVADPPVATPAEAHTDGRLVVYLQANIHGGEVCGKPAYLQLAREILLDPKSSDRRLLDDLVLIFGPIYNADGNDRIAPGNRGPAQNGPELGMGVRSNAQGLDLNRDHMKLASPEAVALVRFLNEWDPHLTIDAHTTDGSRHQFALTYAAPQNPSGHPGPILLTRDAMLPEVTRRLQRRTGLRTFFYGNFDREMTMWATYSHEPRFATPYRGLRNRMSVLSEAYAYDTYEERIVSTREFARECLRWAAENRENIAETIARADRETIDAPKGQSGELVGVRYRMIAYDEPVVIPALMANVRDARSTGGVATNGRDDRSTDYTPRDVTVMHMGWFEPTLRVTRPFAYVLPPEARGVIEKLIQHGVRIERVDNDTAFDAEVYTVIGLTRAEREFQQRRIVRVDAEAHRRRAAVPAGSWVVPMDQPLANLVIYLLEPASDDGLAAWGFYDDWLGEGARLPVLRAMQPRDSWTAASR